MPLRIEHLSKTYAGGIRALDDVSLSIPVGMFGLLGPNGAGKSTLMRILATLQEADTGTATLDPSSDSGQAIDVINDKESVRRTLGYLPQEFGLYPKVTAEDMLDHFAILKGITNKAERRAIVGALLDQTNLSGASKRKLGTFSGGMRQRFGIAVALLGNPRLIIVDEPTAGLDPEERLRFYHLLSELAQDRIVLLSTHIVEDVAVLCPRFAVIREGRLLAVTTPAQARAQIQGHMYEGTVEVADLPRLREERTVTQALLVEGRNRARLYDPGDRPPDGFQPVPVTLEDAYLVLMRHATRNGAAPAAPARENGAPAPAAAEVLG